MSSAAAFEQRPTLASHTLEAAGREIAIALNDARAALEAHLEQPADARLLERCANELHCAQGALRVLAFHGAALLAEEMGQVIRFLQSGPATQPGTVVDSARGLEALDALMRAMVQLPAHVEQVVAGGRDRPLVLLPLLNDLRAARGEALLAEGALLSLNLRSDKQPPLRAAVPDPDVLSAPQWARKLRARYQSGLIGWIRGEASEARLATLADVAAQIETSATTEAVHQLWWVMGAVLEALRDNGLEAGGSVKRLVGLGDRELRRLYEQGESRYVLSPPLELLNNLLYYVARATSSGSRVRAVRESFRLGELLPVDEGLEQARAQLSAPSIRLMQTVAAAIREDLARVKDVLDIFMRQGAAAPEELGPQVDALRRIADTLGVLGLGDQRLRLLEEAERLSALAASRERPADTVLIDIAAHLIQVEDHLDDALLAQVLPAPEHAGGDSPEAELRPVIAAALRECIVNLQQVKDYVTYAVGGNAERLGFENWRDLVHGIQSALALLDKPRAVGVLERLAGHLRRLLLPGGQFPAVALDRLADAMVSLEYYLESLQAGRSEPWYMLDNAETALAANDALVQEQDALREAAAGPDSPGHVDTQVVAPETAAESVEPTGRFRTLPAAVAAPPARAPEPELAADPELLALYLEESRELQLRIESLFASWDLNPLDEVALRDLRRAFHTLKGSGRVVGARSISEFAWAMENLLNRVIDQTVARSPEILDLLREAIQAMPQLVDQLAGGGAPTAAIDRLQNDAHALASGRARSLEQGTAAEVPARPEPVAAAVELPAAAPLPPPDMILAPPRDTVPQPVPLVTVTDDALRDIFARETDGHVRTVRDFLDLAGTEPAPHLLTEAVYRACHTLVGSSRMADARHGIRLAQPLDHWLRKTFESRVGLTNEDLTLLDDCMRAMLDVSRNLDEGTGFFHSHDRLLGRISAAEVGLDARIAAVQAEAAAAADEPAAPAYDPDIAAVFSDEATELLESVQADLASIGEEGASLDGLKRPLHTLKGGARLAGVLPMGDLAHELETLILKLDSGTVARGPAVRALVQDALDELARMRDLLSAGRPVRPVPPLLDRLRNPVEAVSAAPAASPEPLPQPEPAPQAEPQAEPQTEPQAEPVAQPEVVAHPELVAQPEAVQPSVPEPVDPVLQAVLPPGREPQAGPERQEMARVDAELLDRLLNGAGEISIAKARIEQQMGAVESNLGELSRTVTRLKEQLRKLEIETEAQIRHRHEAQAPGREDFDPLELDRYSSIQQYSRALAETASDVDSLQQLLVSLSSDAQNLLQQQGRTLTELQHGLLRTRMVSFQRPAQRLARLVRQVAQETGKQAELTIDGSSHEMDRQVVERMIPPLEHLLRNAVVHGIESSDRRLEQGKPAVGRIDLSLRREGAEVILTVSDDGAGMDLSAIRAKGELLGLIAAGQALSDEDLVQLVLEPGFSTASRVTQSAGRGVGMDVVATEVKKLGGSLRMETQAGQGCSFVIRLPFTLAVSHALVVRVADEWYALPLPTVDGVVRIDRAEAGRLLADPASSFEHAGHHYRLQHLGPYVGLEPSELVEQDQPLPFVLVQAGEHSTALLVDELLGSREIVVKNVGPQIASIRGISGATLLNDGRIVVILDIGALLRAGWRGKPALQTRGKADERPLAMVVDDSITVRRVTQRLLERNGMRVVTARDGADAVELLQEQVPDILLLDIEMPRMDGYEVARQVRADPRTAHLPIIMITSRTGEKHRQRALELGVDEYLGKPYQESLLLDAMAPLLARRTDRT
jgi:chemosensory pili system protein ChpA (sensor histidine kinase/response regulator)